MSSNVILRRGYISQFVLTKLSRHQKNLFKNFCPAQMPLRVCDKIRAKDTVSDKGKKRLQASFSKTPGVYDENFFFLFLTNQ